MATIRPFLAQRFTPETGPLVDLVAPPYDVISPEERERLAAKSKHNTVWLTLPEQLPDDRSKFVKYARSASRLAEWRRDGVLQVDELPAFYRYRQTFVDPVENKERTRTCFITLLKTEPYESGVVLPHEQTFPKHKEDRLRVLEATRSHLECIYGLYRDDANDVATAIDQAEWLPIADFKTDDGVRHELSMSIEETANRKIAAAMEQEKIWIADGHHRYETARAFREMAGDASSLIPEDFILIGLSSMKDPGLALLPTHRIVNGKSLNRNEAASALQRFFNVRTVGNGMLPEEVRALAAPDTRAFGIVLPGGTGLLATLDKPQDALNWIKGDGSTMLKLLDVTILHDVILEQVFEIKGLDAIEYTRDANEAVAIVEASTDKFAIITNPPSVEDMRLIAEGGEKMPQKSTYYYPKLLSGLVFWSMSDFDIK